MLNIRRKIILTFLLLSVFFFFGSKIVIADDATSVSNIPGCKENNILVKDCPSYLQNKVNDLHGQANTLSSQIAVMDNQISLTEARIVANEQQISSLTLDIDTTTKKISGLQASLENLSKVLLNRIKTTYEVGAVQPFQVLLSSSNATNFFSRLNYLKIAQQHDGKLIVETTATKNDYANQKNIFEDKKKQIEVLKKQQEDYSAQLAQQKQSKQVLLAQTQGSEATYQNLLAQAKAQLAAFAGFARTASGGVSIIPHEEKFDNWGKYYNQRDSQWGNNLIGLSGETISSVGCLLTSYAMVSNHFGGNLTPADVAGNSSNFWSNTAWFLKPGPAANGHGVSYVADPSIQELRDALNSGKVVMAGLSINGGPSSSHYSDHWVVLRSVDGDSFRINDPEYAGAMDKSLNDHYSSWTIIEARIYN